MLKARKNTAASCSTFGGLAIAACLSIQPCWAQTNNLFTSVGGDVSADFYSQGEASMSAENSFSATQNGASATLSGDTYFLTTVATLAGNTFSYEVMQFIVPPTFIAQATGSFGFIAGPGQTTYTITDPMPSISGDSPYYETSLSDGMNLLYDDLNGRVTGSLSGNLIPGDLYDFQLGTGIVDTFDIQYLTVAALNASPSITFTPEAAPTSVTPEPSSFALLGTGLLGVAGVLRKRFA